MKRPALQNKQVVVFRMVFRARKVLGTFEKGAPGLNYTDILVTWPGHADNNAACNHKQKSV